MKQSTVWRRTVAAAAGTTLALAAGAPAGADEAPAATPIRHVIIIVGENHTFDNLFGTYRPRAGQQIDNLLEQGHRQRRRHAGPNYRSGGATDWL